MRNWPLAWTCNDRDSRCPSSTAWKRDLDNLSDSACLPDAYRSAGDANRIASALLDQRHCQRAVISDPISRHADGRRCAGPCSLNPNCNGIHTDTHRLSKRSACNESD